MISENLVVTLGSHDLGFPLDVDEKTLGSGIKQCQDFILLVIAEGGTADELLSSKLLLPDVDRNIYRKAIERAIAVSLSMKHQDFKVMVTWAAQTLERPVQREIHKIMDNFYTGLFHCFGNLNTYPIDDYDLFESKEFFDNFQEFHYIDEKRKLMEYVEADDPLMVQRIAACLQDHKLGLETTYLQLQNYEGTKNVRQHIHGTVELSFSEIHEKLLGMFSIDGRTPIQQGMGVTFNPVWDNELLQLPKVKEYLETAGFDFLLELASLALRPQNIIDAHFNSHRAKQCELISEITENARLSSRQIAELFYCGVLGQGIGKVMDLQANGETEFLSKLAIDLCNHDELKVDYINAMVGSTLKSLPSAKIINEICKLEDDAADCILAKLYEKTSDKSILPHLKSYAVKGKLFTMELNI